MSDFKITALKAMTQEGLEPTTIHYGIPGSDWVTLNPSEQTELELKVPFNGAGLCEGALILRLSTDKINIGAEIHCYVEEWGTGSDTTMAFKTSIVGTSFHSERDLPLDQSTIQLSLSVGDGGIVIVGAIDLDPTFPTGH